MVQCESCKKFLKIPDEYIGQEIRCPACEAAVKVTAAAPTGEVFVAPAVKPASRPAAPSSEEVYVAPVARSAAPSRTAVSATFSSATSAMAKGKNLAHRGTAGLAQGTRDVFAGLSAAKAAAQARVKIGALNDQLVATLRALGDEAAQAGWGETCQAILAKKEEVTGHTVQRDKAAADAELAKNTAGSGPARAALTAAEAQLKLSEGVLDGLCEKAGRVVMDDPSTPADIGAAQRTEITRLREEIATCEMIVAHGKRSLISKPMIVAASLILAIALAAIITVHVRPPTHPLKNAKPGDWVRYDLALSFGDRRESGTLLTEVLTNDGKKAKVRLTFSDSRGRSPDTREEEVDLTTSPEEYTMSLLRKQIDDDRGTFESKKGKKTKETVTIAGKKYDCVVVPTTVTITGGPEGETVTATNRVWTAPGVPFGGMVKTESDVMSVTPQTTRVFTTSVTFAAFGNNPAIVRETARATALKAAQEVVKTERQDLLEQGNVSPAIREAAREAAKKAAQGAAPGQSLDRIFDEREGSSLENVISEAVRIEKARLISASGRTSERR